MLWRRQVGVVSGALLTALLAACTSTSAPAADPSASLDAPSLATPSPTPSATTPSPAELSKRIGGVVSGSGATVYIPPGGLSADGDVAIDHAHGSPTAFGGLADAIGSPVSIRLGGADLAPAVPVSLVIPQGQGAAPSSMFLAVITPAGKVRPLLSLPKASGGSLTADVRLPATVGLFRWNVDRMSEAIERALVRQRAASAALSCPTAGVRPLGLVVRLVSWGTTGERMCPVQPRAKGHFTVTFLSEGGVAVDLMTTGLSSRVKSSVQDQGVLDSESRSLNYGGLGSTYLVPPGGQLTLKMRSSDYVDTQPDPMAGLGDAVLAVVGPDPEVGVAKPFLHCLFDIDNPATTVAGVAHCAHRLPGALGMTVATAVTRPSVDATIQKTYAQVPSSDRGVLSQVKISDAKAPVLGLPWAPYQSGYAEFRPYNIDGAGDPGSEFSHTRWVSWGGAKAVGYGTANWLPTPDSFMYQAIPQPAEVVAYDLGTCGGHLAYLRLDWFFPEHGEHFDAKEGFSICDP